jgi:hypothetical protein
LRFFFFCRWRWLSPPARKGRGEEAEPDPAVFQLLAAARGKTRRHCSCGGRRASLQFLEFRDYFVIFKLCNVIFV